MFRETDVILSFQARRDLRKGLGGDTEKAEGIKVRETNAGLVQANKQTNKPTNADESKQF